MFLRAVTVVGPNFPRVWHAFANRSLQMKPETASLNLAAGSVRSTQAHKMQLQVGSRHMGVFKKYVVVPDSGESYGVVQV